MPSIFDDIEESEIHNKFSGKVLTKQEVKQRLHRLVPRAFATLERNLFADDEKVQVQAALGILDRCGYGPQSKMTIEDEREDLSSLSSAELAARALQLARQVQEQEQQADNPAFDVH